jgi:hypothetical protein
MVAEMLARIASWFLYFPALILLLVMGGVLLAWLLGAGVVAKTYHDVRKDERQGKPPKPPLIAEPFFARGMGAAGHKNIKPNTYWEQLDLIEKRVPCAGPDCEVHPIYGRHCATRGCDVFVYRRFGDQPARVYVDGCAERERRRYTTASPEEKYRLRSGQLQ